MSDVEPLPVDWLWRGRIPFGAVTILDGDPDLGKSTVTLDLVARVSTGAPMPGEHEGREPSQAIIISAEDDPARTIRPRLDAAGADTSRVLIIDGIAEAKPTSDPPIDVAITLAPADIEEIEREVGAHAARLVVIDPFMAYVPGKVDAHKDAEIRRVMAPLAAMAQRTGAAVLVVRHFKKGEANAKSRGAGSMGIIGAARSGLVVGEVKSEPEWKLLAVSKGNLASERDKTTIRYRLTSVGDHPRIEWGTVAEGVTADDLAAITTGGAKAGGKLADAKSVLSELLAGGPVPAADAERAITDRTDCSPATLQRARKELGVVSAQARGIDGRAQAWLWSLPSHDRDDRLAGADRVN